MYNLLYENPNEDIFTRLLKIRNISDDIENFLKPKFSNTWIDPYQLNDLEKAVKRITKAIENNEKIMIFGDYDVDGITASFLVYSFFTQFLKHKKISIRLPNRMHDGYGIKGYHLDEIKELGVSLVITVDNGITAVKEMQHAHDIGLDVIITDHHKALDSIPEALAIVNPQVSKDYPFKGLSGVGVAFKLITALANKLIKDKSLKDQILNYFLPIVAIGTVADCVPLVSENRLFVKMGLEIINQKRGIPPSLKNFLEYLNIKSKIDTFHIGYMIAPRLNAGGRLIDPYDSLYCLLTSDKLQQTKYIQKLEDLNKQRKKLQDEAFKEAEKQIDKESNMLIAYSEDFMEGIIGLVAGKLTEKYNKPSVVVSINKAENKAVGSLRGPEYFDIVDMLNQAGDLMENYGGHKQAGGMTTKLENLDKALDLMDKYAKKTLKKKERKKIINVDTPIYGWELKEKSISEIDRLAPFGEGNNEPIFLLDKVIINKAEKVGKNGNGHMKMHVQSAGIQFHALFWGKGSEIDNIERNVPKKLIGKIKKDDYNGGFYIDGDLMI